MSRSWTEQELQAASKAMKAAGYMGYEEFCEELERQEMEQEQEMEQLPGNRFEADYMFEQSLLSQYKPAEDYDDTDALEETRATHNDHMVEIECRGRMYCRLYREYELSRDSGNELLDINDVVWDKDVEELINCMRENGIRRFTFSSTWSGAVETAWLFQKNGCRLIGLAEINSRTKKILSDEHEKAHGYVFEL